MTISEMRKVLSERDLQLTKSLGQNFLHDGNQLRRIVETAELKPNDSVLEIGPGLGPLTEQLLAKAGNVLAIELDSRLVKVLQERFRSALAPGGKLELVQADALHYLRENLRDWSSWKLVANLPYSVASPVLVELALGGKGPERMVATLQAEVATRLMAQPGNSDYGVLTLLVQLDYQPGGTFKIPCTCFFPEPDVASSCICLTKRPQPLLDSVLRPVFTRIVKLTFSQRRKMMAKLLKAQWPSESIQRAFEEVGLQMNIRAEQVYIEQFVRITEILATQSHRAEQLVSNSSVSTPPPLHVHNDVHAEHLIGHALDIERQSPPPSGPKGEEVFDVVDAQDVVTGQRPRSEVHRLGLLHRAAHVLVFNSKGEVFLQKRSMLKDRQPGVWDSSASGHLNTGEDYATAAARELAEEIGLVAAAPLKFLFKLSPSKDTDSEHVCVYRCHAEGPLKLDPLEIQEGEWVTQADVSQRLHDEPEQFATAFRVIWPRVAESPEIG